MKSTYFSLIVGAFLALGTTSCEDKLDIAQKGIKILLILSDRRAGTECC